METTKHCLLFFLFALMPILATAYTDKNTPYIDIVDSLKIEDGQQFREYYTSIIPANTIDDTSTYVIKLLNNLLPFSEKFATHDLTVDLHNRMGIWYLKNKKDLPLAEIHLKKGYQLAQKEKPPIYLGKIANALGICKMEQGQHQEALKYFIECEQTLIQTQDSSFCPFNNISKTYYLLGDVSNAIHYIKKDFRFLNKNQEIKNLNIALLSNHISLSGYYMRLSERDSALISIHSALQLLPKVDTTESTTSAAIGKTYLLASIIYLEKQQFSEAKEYLDKAQNYAKFFGELYPIVQLHYLLSTKDTKKITDAFAAIPDTIQRMDYKTYLLSVKTKYYQFIGDIDKALQAQQDWNLHKLRIQKINNNHLISLKEAQLVTVKQKEQIELLQKDNSLIELREWYLFWGCILSISLLAVTLVLFVLYRQKSALLIKGLENKKTIEIQAHKLKEANESQTKLLSNISHELRTPLTLISGPISRLLKQKDLPMKIRRQLQLVYENSQQLSQLTNQLVDLSQNTSVELFTTISRFRLHELLYYTIVNYKVLARSKNIQITVPDYIEENIELYTDAEKLFIIVKNLLTNAIKFTPIGGNITLTYSQTTDNVELSIKDTGKGISSEALPFIFERHYQVQNANNNSEEGMGIGLAICKEYIELLDGTIQIDSELGKGSTFTVSFPKRLTQISGASIPVYQFNQFLPPEVFDNKLPPSNSVDDSLEHLLIVEDNQNLAKYLQSILVEDYNLSIASNGKEALKLIETITPSVIITDLMMPEMDGYELIANLKQKEATSSIPILVLTALNKDIDRITDLRIGLDNYIMKPFEDSVLKTHISHLLEFQENRQEEALLSEEAAPEQPLLSAKDQAWLSTLESTIFQMISNLGLTLDDVAAEMTLSKTHLNRKIKHTTGITAKRYIQEIRLTEARRMLENKEHASVKAIAYSVGFRSPKYFARNFKKRFGKYPSEYL